MIPRIIHRVWLGPNPMPEDFQRYGRSWREHHPDWEMRLWTDGNLPELRFPEALERCRNHGERSDLIRYEVLVHFGGVYVDTDVECLRSIAPLTDVPAFAGETRPGKLGSAVLASVPEHPGFQQLLELGSERVGSGHQAASAGPRLVTDVLTGRDDVKVLPSHVFYPFHHRRQPDKDAGFEGAYAVHHVEASWKSRDDLRQDIRRLRGRLEQAQQDQRKLRRARRRAARAEARRREAESELRQVRRRLRAVERTRWWRARVALARGRKALRRS